MSDEIRFSLVVSEGAHDVEAVGKILRLKDFNRARRLDQVPEELRAAIPTRYPVHGDHGELSRFVAHPTFFFRENYWILASNANGNSKLGENLRDVLSSFRKQYTDAALCGIAILTDADKRDAPKAREVLFQQLANEFAGEDDLAFDPDRPSEIEVSGSSKPLAMYIFPDDQNSGTLENVLLDGARLTYPALLSEAEKYVAHAKTLPDAGELADASKGDKATVGVVTNALKPGKANQVSICDNDWFSDKSLAEVSSHRALSEFIDLIVRWNTI